MDLSGPGKLGKGKRDDNEELYVHYGSGCLEILIVGLIHTEGGKWSSLTRGLEIESKNYYPTHSLPDPHLQT